MGNKEEVEFVEEIAALVAARVGTAKVEVEVGDEFMASSKLSSKSILLLSPSSPFSSSSSPAALRVVGMFVDNKEGASKRSYNAASISSVSSVSLPIWLVLLPLLMVAIVLIKSPAPVATFSSTTGAHTWEGGISIYGCVCLYVYMCGLICLIKTSMNGCADPKDWCMGLPCCSSLRQLFKHTHTHTHIHITHLLRPHQIGSHVV